MSLPGTTDLLQVFVPHCTPCKLRPFSFLFLFWWHLFHAFVLLHISLFVMWSHQFNFEICLTHLQWKILPFLSVLTVLIHVSLSHITAVVELECHLSGGDRTGGAHSLETTTIHRQSNYHVEMFSRRNHLHTVFELNLVCVAIPLFYPFLIHSVRI